MKILKNLLQFVFILFVALTSSFQKNNEIPVTSNEKANLLHLSRNINSSDIEYTPFISPDEKYLFFESDRAGGVGLTGDFDLWFSYNTSTNEKPKFSVPRNFGKPINTEFFDGLPSLRINSQGDWELYFTSFATKDRTGKKETNIYYSKRNNNKWSKPISLQIVNSDFHDRMPSISSDGKKLYFSSNRPGGFGKDDIWMSEFDTSMNSWKKPINLGAKVNTVASEISPSIHPDTITLYFSSNKSEGVGGFDMYVTQIIPSDSAETTWKPSKNLGTPYNSKYDDEYPTVLKNGKSMYFTSNRPGGYGQFDIYKGDIPYFAKPKVIITLKGRVYEEDSTKGIESNIKISSSTRDANENRNIASMKPNGNYTIDFTNRKIYQLLVTAPGYQPQTHTLDLRNKHTSETIQKNFKMKKEFKVPKQYFLDIRFLNKEETVLYPDATYTIQSKGQNQEDIALLKNRSYMVPIDIPQNIKTKEQFQNYLDNTKVRIKGNLKNYDKIDLPIPLNKVINASTPPSKHIPVNIVINKLKKKIDKKPEETKKVVERKIDKEEKQVKIPETYFVNINFINIKDEKLHPNTTYSINNKTQKNLVLKDGKYQIPINVPKNIKTKEQLDNFLNNTNISINGNLDKYNPVQVDMPLNKVIQNTTVKNYSVNVLLRKEDAITTEVQRKYLLNVDFKNADGTILHPESSYSINRKTRKKLLLKKNQYKIQVDIPKKIKTKKQLQTYIDNSNINIKGSHKNYESINEDIAMNKVIDASSDFIAPISILLKKKPSINQSGKKKYFHRVYYKTNYTKTYVNTKETIKKLKELVQMYKANKSVKILIEGHTDTPGSRKLNDSLSRKRAIYLKNKLMKMGISYKNIKVKYYAYTKPRFKETSKKKRNLNRRAEIKIIK